MVDHLRHRQGVRTSSLEALVAKHFDLRPKGIMQMLDLLRPIYSKTAAYGHFGRNEPEFTWEKTDKAAGAGRAMQVARKTAWNRDFRQKFAASSRSAAALEALRREARQDRADRFQRRSLTGTN